MSEITKNDIEAHRALKNAYSQLETEREPSKDLWPEIKQQLSERSQKKTNITNRWMAWGMAATLLMSVGVLSVSFNQFKQAEFMLAKVESLNEAFEDKLIRQVDFMEREYQLAKNSYLNQIRYQSSSFSSIESSQKIAKQLEAFKKATLALKSAIKAEPNNPNYPRLLKATYHQELEVLSQLAKLNQNVFSEERI